MVLPDVVIIGAGVIGAACAFYAAHAGLSVTVLERGRVAGGATAVGQGALLASDKAPGPALDLALASLRSWDDLGAELGNARLTLTRRGGIAVATEPGEMAALNALAIRQRAAGLEAVELPGGQLRRREPLLAAGLAGGVLYPGERHVDPVRATAHLLRASGAEVRCGVDVRGLEVDGGTRVTGVRTANGDRLGCSAVINAAGAGAGTVADLAGTRLPVVAGDGAVLSTEALGSVRTRRIPIGRIPVDGVSAAPAGPPDGFNLRHTVYTAPEMSVLVSAGRAGSVRISAGPGGAGARAGGGSVPWAGGGSVSRHPPDLRGLAAAAVGILPFLAEVRVLRATRGSIPATPDRLPIIGPDPWIAGLYHACGHAESGVCYAPVTGALTARMITSDEPGADLSGRDSFAFAPERFG